MAKSPRASGPPVHALPHAIIQGYGGRLDHPALQIPGVRVKRVPGVRNGYSVEVPFYIAPDVFPAAFQGPSPGIQPVQWGWSGTGEPKRLTLEQTHARLMRFIPPELWDTMRPWQPAASSYADWPGLLLVHATGSGKSITGALNALAGLPDTPRDQIPSILYVTKSGTRVQVAEDIKKLTRGMVIPFAIKPKSSRRKTIDWWMEPEEYAAWAAAEGVPPVYVVAWENLKPWKEQLLALKPHTIIYDEIQHGGRNHHRWDAVQIPYNAKAAEKIRQRVKEHRRDGAFTFKGRDGQEVAMLPVDNMVSAAATLSRQVVRRVAQTATYADLTRDLWSVLDLILPGGEGSWRQWSDFFVGAREGQYGQRDTRGATNIDLLRARLDRIRHTVTQEELERFLPPKTRRSERLDATQWGPPDPEITAALNAVGEGKVSPARRTTLRLAQTAYRKSPAVAARMLDLVIEANGSSMRQMAWFTIKEHGKRFARMLKAAAAHRKIDVDVLYSDGSHSPRRKAKIKAQYTSHQGAVILVCTPAWATGIDGLQCTNHQHHVVLPYTPYEIEQREGRARRNGQDRPITYWYWYAVETIDDRLADINLVKRGQQEALGTTGALDGIDNIVGGIGDSEALKAAIVASIADVEGMLLENGEEITYDD